jgi:hypothetical protein
MRAAAALASAIGGPGFIDNPPHNRNHFCRRNVR